MNESTESLAEIVTDRPARYGKQLVSHLSRRSPGTWDEPSGSGEIRFSSGQARLRVDAHALIVQLKAEPGTLAVLEEVIGSHLVRFATRDRLVVEWMREDGTQGARFEGGDSTGA